MSCDERPTAKQQEEDFLRIRNELNQASKDAKKLKGDIEKIPTHVKRSYIFKKRGKRIIRIDPETGATKIFKRKDLMVVKKAKLPQYQHRLKGRN